MLWVGVRCAPEVAAGREIARGDRIDGMAASQATIVHEGVRYDIEVDTGTTESIDCARAIAAFVATGGRVSASPGAHGPGSNRTASPRLGRPVLSPGGTSMDQPGTSSPGRQFGDVVTPCQVRTGC